MNPSRTGWTFLTNHAAVLLAIHQATVVDGTHIRVRDIAQRVGVTERTVQHVLNDLEEDGYILRRRAGRRTHYQINHDMPLRQAGTRDIEVGTLLAVLCDELA